LLATYGFYRGRVDGIVGSRTYQALFHFQNSVGINVSGLIDGETFLALHHPEIFTKLTP
jgi:peptidoglycan hydrolase-like protein with peptidoglycan-binding domain